MPALTQAQQEVRTSARKIAEATLRPAAAQIDRERRYPRENLKAIGAAGLMGVLVPKTYGGCGGTLTDLALAGEAFGWGCSSTAMCFLMHSCGCAVIASKATPEQGNKWLKAAAKGDAIATLAFSERGSGAHFYAPEIKAERKNGTFTLNGRKSFITSGGNAGLYPVLVNASGAPGLDLLVLTPDTPGVKFEGQWDGIGMAGNSSISMTLTNAAVPAASLLGKEGDGQEVVFSVVAPTFLIGLAAVNVGIAQAALDATIEHAKTRKYPTGQTLSQVQAIQMYIAGMSIDVAQTRTLVLEAARAADAGEPTALTLVMQAKIAATEAAMRVTETAMQVGGGQAYSRATPIERYWRDARAGAVMAPTNEVLKEWLGKVFTGLPLF
ncbi:MAG: acyl-CoA/acyl-ACP dehydrogenase [Chloroflexi bacterium]|nr:acyl-CoA/acyl-ACP dehydrogenase [Chloroflexota bacterium]